MNVTVSSDERQSGCGTLLSSPQTVFPSFYMGCMWYSLRPSQRSQIFLKNRKRKTNIKWKGMPGVHARSAKKYTQMHHPTCSHWHYACVCVCCAYELCVCLHVFACVFRRSIALDETPARDAIRKLHFCVLNEGRIHSNAKIHTHTCTAFIRANTCIHTRADRMNIQVRHRPPNKFDGKDPPICSHSLPVSVF